MQHSQGTATVNFDSRPRVAANPPLCCAAFLCIVQSNTVGMEEHLSTVTAGLVSMQQLLDRMGEHCDPYIYYQRVRVPM